MSATIYKLPKTLLNNSAAENVVKSTKATQTNESLSKINKLHQSFISGLNGTNLDAVTTEISQFENVSIERIYPHVFDVDASTGQVRNHILKALDNAQRALDFYSEPDLESINTNLTAIAAIMRSAHLLTEFNESLGAVISFLRRATLISTSETLTRSALNVLVHVLQSIAVNPMVDLDEACDLIDKLEDEGWCGEHGAAEQLVTILFDELASENYTELQTSLFDEQQPETTKEGDA